MTRRHPPEELRESAGPLFDSPATVAVARERGHAAAEAASDRAERIEPSWRAKALAAVQEHARSHEWFLVEDLRGSISMPPGADRRALGHVVKDAAKLGLVVADGFAPAVSSNGSAKVRWRSLIYRSRIA